MLLAAALLLSTVEYRYWIAPCDRARETECRAGDAELARWAFEDWERVSQGALKFTPVANREAAEIRVVWVSQREGLYGEARPIVVNGRQGAELYVRPAMDGLGADVEAETRRDPLFRDTIVYLTCLHESGHALGLGHTDRFADIMYSFGFGGDIREYFARYRRKLSVREDIRKTSGASELDGERLRRTLQNDNGPRTNQAPGRAKTPGK
ncbi:hypothetical protein F183_A39870 [Bryobacterales bacterium F-183]|nr:hypothetical protein F183_A39870 [Bryobacterales bacterium F-183]